MAGPSLVRSHFRNRWYGIILGRDRDLLLVAIVRDRTGNTMRKRIIMALHENWTTKSTFSLEGINPDWLTKPPQWERFT